MPALVLLALLQDVVDFEVEVLKNLLVHLVKGRVGSGFAENNLTLRLSQYHLNDLIVLFHHLDFR